MNSSSPVPVINKYKQKLIQRRFLFRISQGVIQTATNPRDCVWEYEICITLLIAKCCFSEIVYVISCFGEISHTRIGILELNFGRIGQYELPIDYEILIGMFLQVQKEKTQKVKDIAKMTCMFVWRDFPGYYNVYRLIIPDSCFVLFFGFFFDKSGMI